MRMPEKCRNNNKHINNNSDNLMTSRHTDGDKNPWTWGENMLDFYDKDNWMPRSIGSVSRACFSFNFRQYLAEGSVTTPIRCMMDWSALVTIANHWIVSVSAKKLFSLCERGGNADLKEKT